jgi:hypothetical protein
MKTKILLFSLLFSTFAFSQSKFSTGVGVDQLYLKDDSGTNYEAFVGYKVHSDITINLVGSFATMETKATDMKYNINKYALLVSYDFAKSEKVKLESVFGFSYLYFDKKLLLDDNQDLGIDLGFKTTFGLKNKINYGFKLISTYASIAPGGLLNAGSFIKYNF